MRRLKMTIGRVTLHAELFDTPTADAIYAAAPGQRLVVLHAFVKKTQKTPHQAIELARRRMKEI